MRTSARFSLKHVVLSEHGAVADERRSREPDVVEQLRTVMEAVGRDTWSGDEHATVQDDWSAVIPLGQHRPRSVGLLRQIVTVVVAEARQDFV